MAMTVVYSIKSNVLEKAFNIFPALSMEPVQALHFTVRGAMKITGSVFSIFWNDLSYWSDVAGIHWILRAFWKCVNAWTYRTFYRLHSLY